MTKCMNSLFWSATVDLDLFSRYLDICPVITVQNRTHCITTCFLEDIHESINSRLASDSPALEDTKQVPETRGKKNLVLSGWGDETLLSEEYVNPHYVPHNYQSHGEELNLRRMYKDVSDDDLLEDLVCTLMKLAERVPFLYFCPEFLTFTCYMIS